MIYIIMKGVDYMNIYIIILCDGRKFYVESYESYEKIYNRYKKRYGDGLACVLREYLFTDINEIKKERMVNNEV